MTHAIRIHTYGGPEVMEWEPVDVGAPGPGEIRLKQSAVGLNYIDVYVRTGSYPQPSLPFTPGMEGAGEIVAVGEGVLDLAIGERVAYAGPVGSYAEERLIAADRVVTLPDGIDERTGAAMMLQGMTVRYLLRKTFDVQPGTVILFHAAAGGVGLIACQWAKHLGATLIGTAGSDEKCAVATAHGATHMINYNTENFVERVQELTGGRGCDVVYDSIGQASYPSSLDCLRPFGLFVSFGAASGPITDFDIGLLAKKGSLFMTRPTLFTYIAQRNDLLATAADLFDVVKSGAVKITINQTYDLKNAIAAHSDLEARRTTGSTIFVTG